MRFALLCLASVLPASPLAQADSGNSLLSVRADSKIAACSNRDSGTLTIVDLSTMKNLREIKVGLHPEGTTFVGQSEKVACCVYGDDVVLIADSRTGKIERRITVFDEPYGIVSTADGKTLFVTLEYPGQVIRIDVATGKITDTWSHGRMLRGIALSRDESQIYVTEYLHGNIIVADSLTGQIISTLQGTERDNIARSIVAHPSSPKLYVPHWQSKVDIAHGNGSIFPYVSVVTTEGKESGRRLRIAMDSFRGARVVANPWEVALSPDAKRLYTIFAATNDLYVADVEDDDYFELSYRKTMTLGNNPRAVRTTPDGSFLLVYNALDFELVAYDLQTLAEVGRITTTQRPYDEEMHMGKLLFYTARQPMSGRQWIACSSCHIDGDADGRTWQQPEGLRQTQPLRGLAFTHPLHWSADRDEVQDFEHTIRGLLMQGRGLARGRIPGALEDPISGQSRSLDALAVYTNSHEFPLSPHATSGLTSEAKLGQKLFHSEKTGCAKCHSGPYFSDSTQGQFIKHDVGTGRHDASELMGYEYDTPTLLGVYRSAPYLHDGTAATLKDVLTNSNPADQHGATSHLTDSEVNQLIAYLKSLPFQSPEAAARKAGMVEVRK